MTAEAEEMLKAIFIHYKNKRVVYEGVPVKLSDLKDLWQGKDLESNLNAVLYATLKPAYIEALTLRCRGASYEEIGKSMGFSKVYAYDLCRRSIVRLTRKMPMTALTIGFEEYKKQTEEAARMKELAITTASPVLNPFDMGLSTRAVNRLFRFGIFTRDPMTKEDLQNRLDLHTPVNIKSIGSKLTAEIIECLKPFGLDMSLWEDDLETMVSRHKKTDIEK